jgi:L-ascorbate metabolism protein UlaG (beta-lactamase superfamily)
MNMESVNRNDGTDSALENARLALLEHPAERTPLIERRRHLPVIQAAADLLKPEEYTAYRQAWSTDGAAAMERCGILGHLRRCIDHAIADFRSTRVKHGMALWLVYNMGCLVRTPSAGFGIDLAFNRAEDLVDDLDFLLTTHEHADHYTPALLNAMIAAKKPCVTRWWPQSTLLNETAALRFKDVSVGVTIGDHHFRRPETCNNMLMFHIQEGDAALLHSGDNSNIDKLPKNLQPDLFMFHCAVGLPVADAIRHVTPRLALPAHVLELEHSPHPPHAWRWPFEYGFETVRDFSPAQAPLLTWGERILASGTALASP